jgi:hypothetical protein
MISAGVTNRTGAACPFTVTTSEPQLIGTLGPGQLTVRSEKLEPRIATGMPGETGVVEDAWFTTLVMTGDCAAAPNGQASRINIPRTAGFMIAPRFRSKFSSNP